MKKTHFGGKFYYGRIWILILTLFFGVVNSGRHASADVGVPDATLVNTIVQEMVHRSKAQEIPRVLVQTYMALVNPIVQRGWTPSSSITLHAMETLLRESANAVLQRFHAGAAHEAIPAIAQARGHLETSWLAFLENDRSARSNPLLRQAFTDISRTLFNRMTAVLEVLPATPLNSAALSNLRLAESLGASMGTQMMNELALRRQNTARASAARAAIAAETAAVAENTAAAAQNTTAAAERVPVRLNAARIGAVLSGLLVLPSIKTCYDQKMKEISLSSYDPYPRAHVLDACTSGSFLKLAVNMAVSSTSNVYADGQTSVRRAQATLEHDILVSALDPLNKAHAQFGTDSDTHEPRICISELTPGINHGLKKCIMLQDIPRITKLDPDFVKYWQTIALLANDAHPLHSLAVAFSLLWDDSFGLSHVEVNS